MKAKLVLIWLLLTPLDAFARETIRWIVYPAFPPARITEGPLAGQGIIDRQLAWLISHLPEFDHVQVEASNARAFHEIASRDGQCVIDVFKTSERSKLALFSRPALFHRPPGLLVRNDRLAALAPVLTADGGVDLGKLALLRLSGAVVPDRHFTPVLTHFLEEAGGLTPVSSVQQALAMVSRGRIDYTFGYVSEERYYRLTASGTAELTFMPIAGEPRLVPVYIACSRGPIGERAIKTIDQVLAATDGAGAFLPDVQRWLEPEEYREIRDAMERLSDYRRDKASAASFAR